MDAIPDTDHSSIPLLSWYNGLHMDPPQTIFWILAHYLTTANRYPDAKKAFRVINMGLKYHPKSPYLHEKLGAAYELNKEPQRALEAYQEALRLNPANETAKTKIQQLKDQK